MKAVILAAGEGKRMWPLTHSRPKVMLPLVNRPVMEHIIMQLAKAGIKEIVLVTGYHEEIIKEYFGDGSRWGVAIEYVNQQKQSGTADALRMAKSRLSQHFLVLNGDIIVSSDDIAKLIDSQKPAMAGITSNNLFGLGVVEVDNNRIVRIHEKSKEPPSHMVNAGLYYLDRCIFDAIDRTAVSSRGEYELTDSLQILIDGGYELFLVEIEQWFDLGYPWSLLNANQWFCKKLSFHNSGCIEEYAVVKGAVSIGEGTVIRSGSYIVGPVIIGKNCQIGPNCYIRPYSSIGNGCHIGASVEVKNAIIMQNSSLPHHNYVGDSIIGVGCNLGAGTKIANLRLDKKEMKVADMPTGLRKFGAVIGDGVQTGINASINCGCIIGERVFIGPNALAAGVINSGVRIDKSGSIARHRKLPERKSG